MSRLLKPFAELPLKLMAFDTIDTHTAILWAWASRETIWVQS